MIDTYIFIGMAGIGKSTIGKAISKHFKLQFFDIDKIIIKNHNLPLHKIINTYGTNGFHQIESEELLNHLGNNNIISPGGSFIHSEKTIQSIQPRCLFIFLDDHPSNILKRIPDIKNRGITGLEHRSFEDIYFERKPLYKKYANVTFNLENNSFKNVTKDIINYLNLIIN